MATRIIGFVQSKGGVGKTTTALNLAAELTRRRHSVLLIDADPSGSAKMVAEDNTKMLTGVSEAVIAAKKLGFRVESMLIENEDDDAAIGIWARAVRREIADFVLLDAPGQMGAAFGATIAVSDLVLVPSGATVLDVRGAAETIGIIRRHRKSANLTKPDIMIVPTRIDRRTGAGKDVFTTLAALREPIAPSVSYRAVVADSLAAGETVPLETPSGEEFAALADAVLTRLGDTI